MSERLSHRAIRQQEADRSRAEINKTRANEIRALDSGYLYYGGQGDNYDSPLVEHFADNGTRFDFTFSKVLPEEYSEWKDLKVYIEDVLAPKKGHAIGLELGGPASRLWRGFSPGIFEITAGMCLVDSRDDTDILWDRRNNHSVLEGDITTDEGKQEVTTWTGGKKIDLLFMRMMGPHHALPNEPFFMAQEAAYWYEQLAEGGLLFTQLPHAFEHTIEKWKKYIATDYRGVLDVQTDHLLSTTHLRLHKLSGAPKELPLLDARTVLKQQRELHNYSGTNRKH